MKCLTQEGNIKHKVNKIKKHKTTHQKLCDKINLVD